MSTLKQILRKRRVTEHTLSTMINLLFTRGAWLSTCAGKEKSVEGRRYKIAKQRYEDTIKECEKQIQMIRQQVNEAEAKFSQVERFNKMDKEYAAERSKPKHPDSDET